MESDVTQPSGVKKKKKNFRSPTGNLAFPLVLNKKIKVVHPCYLKSGLRTKVLDECMCVLLLGKHCMTQPFYHQY